MKKRIEQHGFTLIEAVIVIAIIGIMATIIVPLITTTTFQYYSRTEARELAIQFKKAKLEAVKRNRDVCIDFFYHPTEPKLWYRIFVNADRDANAPHTIDAGDIVLVNRQLRSNVQFQGTTFTNNQAGYNFRGLPLQASNQNIVLGAPGSRIYTLAVSQTGNVSIQ